MRTRNPHHFRSGAGRLVPAVAMAATVMAGVAMGNAVAGAASSGASPPAAKQVVLTNADNGTTTLVTTGEQVVVKLGGDGLQWTEASVASTTASPVLRKTSGHVASDGSSVTKFVVVGYGTAALQATGTPRCAPGTACPQFVVLWRATVDAPVTDPPVPAAVAS